MWRWNDRALAGGQTGGWAAGEPRKKGGNKRRETGVTGHGDTLRWGKFACLICPGRVDRLTDEGTKAIFANRFRTNVVRETERRPSTDGWIDRQTDGRMDG